jgi:hypothetical protein
MKKLWKSWFLQHQNCNITPEVIAKNATGLKVSPFGKIKLTVGNSILKLLQQQQFAQIQQHSPHFKISEYKHDYNQNPPKKNRLSAALITTNPTRRFSQEQLVANMKYYVNVCVELISQQQDCTTNSSGTHKCDNLDDLRCLETKIKIKRSESKCSQIEIW